VSLTDGVEVQQVGRPHIPGIFHTTTLTPSQNTRDVKNMFLRQVFVVLNLLCFFGGHYSEHSTHVLTV